jgi:hypothetical protein
VSISSSIEPEAKMGDSPLGFDDSSSLRIESPVDRDLERMV